MTAAHDGWKRVVRDGDQCSKCTKALPVMALCEICDSDDAAEYPNGYGGVVSLCEGCRADELDEG